MINWNYHRDSQGRNVYQVNEPGSNPHDYCMCSLHARNSMSLSSLSSLNLSSPSPSPPDGPLMLSMQYTNYVNTMKPAVSVIPPSSNQNRKSYNRHKSSNRSRRLSGTFIPEHHIISVPVKSKVKRFLQFYFHTVRNLHIWSKNSTLISRENCRFFGWKTRENVVILDFLAVDNFDFTRKIVKKNLGEKLVKMFF